MIDIPGRLYKIDHANIKSSTNLPMLNTLYPNLPGLGETLVDHEPMNIDQTFIFNFKYYETGIFTSFLQTRKVIDAKIQVH